VVKVEQRGGQPVPYSFDVGAIVVATGYDLYAKRAAGASMAAGATPT